jgi:hypothetical protein
VPVETAVEEVAYTAILRDAWKCGNSYKYRVIEKDGRDLKPL